MKIKLISLIAALLCFTALLVSCSDPCTAHVDANFDGVCDNENCEDTIQESTVECAEHVDANKDGMCDTENCKTAVKVETVTETVIEEVEVYVPNTKEEAVPMVVKPIPSEAKVSDYFSYDYKTNTLIYNTSTVDEVKYGEALPGYYLGNILVFKTTAETVAPVADNPETAEVDETVIGKSQDTYTLYDFVENVTVITYVTDEYETEGSAPAVMFGEMDIMISALENTSNVSHNTSKVSLYTSCGDVMLSKLVFNISMQEPVVDSSSDSRVTYVTWAGVTYAIDSETAELLSSGDSALFIKRPQFDYVTDKYGIVINDNEDRYEFYDLAKWFSLSYVYEHPAYAYVENCLLLENGTVLVESWVELPDSAVSCDVYDGWKYDIVYTIIDPAAKSSKNVEFGYDIIDEWDESEYVTDKALNILEVYTIENTKINSNNTKILVVDNELNILCELPEYVPGQVSPSHDLVADNLTVVSVSAGDNVLYAVVNEKGEFVTYLPESYAEYDGYISIGNKLYNYDMSVIVDLDKLEEDYDMGVYDAENYYLLAKTNAENSEIADFYYYNIGLAAPVLIGTSDKVEIESISEDLFVVVTSTEIPSQEEGGTPTITYAYSVYNSSNGLIATYDKEIIDIAPVADYYLVTLADGTLYRITAVTPAA